MGCWAHSGGQISQRTTASDETFLNKSVMAVCLVPELMERPCVIRTGAGPMSLWFYVV